MATATRAAQSFWGLLNPFRPGAWQLLSLALLWLVGGTSHAEPTVACSAQIEPLLRAFSQDANHHGANAQAWGWLDLLEQVAASPCRNRAVALERWRLSHPQHPAPQLLPGLFGAMAPLLPVALLPLSGELGPHGAALLQGLRQADHPDSALLFLDTPDVKAIPGSLQQAMALEARCLIGPLSKDQVAALANQQPRLPVLALNQLREGELPSPGLYQIGARPEDEAWELAQQLLEAGHFRGLELLPANGRAQRRQALAFAKTWQELGGELTAATYAPGTTDQTRWLDQHLSAQQATKRRHPDDEQQPTDAPQGQLRDDLDFIILFADHANALLLYPQIGYWNAGLIPVYATSLALPPAMSQPEPDFEHLRLSVPAWFFQRGRLKDHRPTLDETLEHLGQSAMTLVRNSQCLSSGFVRDRDVPPDWHFDPSQALFRARIRLVEYQQSQAQALQLSRTLEER